VARYSGTDRDDYFGFPDNTGNDEIDGRDGNDTLLGGAGNDDVSGDAGDDVLDGNSGDDEVKGNGGNDVGIYTLAENTKAPGSYASDLYDGGRGSDTLRLFFSAEEFARYQSEIVALDTFIRSHRNTSSTSTSSEVTFATSFGLRARNWELLQVFVNGEEVDPSAPPLSVDLDADDSAATGTSFQTSFTEDRRSAPIADADLRIAGLGSQGLRSATVTILERPDGSHEALVLSDDVARQFGVAVSRSEPGGPSGPLVLTLTGVASASAYEQLLRSIEYENSSDDPVEGARLIRVVVNDGRSDSSAAFTTLTVVAINDPPENAVPGSVTLREDPEAPVAIPAQVGDPEAGRLRVSVGVEHGTLSLGSTGSVDFLEGDGAQDRRIVIEGSPAQVNARLAGLVYSPEADFAGTDALHIATSDLGSRGQGGALEDVDHVALTVLPVNDSPTLEIGSDPTVDEDSFMTMVPRFAVATPGGGLDEAGQSLTFAVSNDDNALFALQPVITPWGALVFAPAPNVSGRATVTVTAVDDGPGSATSPTRTFAIEVRPVNDPPILKLLGDWVVTEDSGSSSVSEFARALPGGGADEASQTAFAYTVDVDDEDLFASTPRIDSGGRLTFTPAKDAAGTTGVGVTVTDSLGASVSQRFSITIKPENDAPTFALNTSNVVVAEDSGRTSLDLARGNPGGGKDESNQGLLYSVTTKTGSELFAEAPAISPSGRLTFAPASNANGSATVTVYVSDEGGAESEPQTLAITVNPVNDAPILFLAGDQSVLEDSGAREVLGFATGFPGGGPDEAGQALIGFKTVAMNPGLFAVAPAVSRDGTLTYALRPDAVGSSRVLVSVTDDGGKANGGTPTSAIDAFTVTVHGVNDRPSLALLGDQSVLEDAVIQPVRGFALAHPGGGSDEAAQTFTYTVNVTKSDNPALFQRAPTISPAGELSYQLAPDQSGTAVLAVTVTDSGGVSGGGIDTSAAQSFQITVNPVNDKPTVSLRDHVALEDSGPAAVEGIAVAYPGGVGEEGQSFHYDVSASRPELFATGPTISPQGALSYTPKPDAAGTSEVSVRVTDSGGAVSDVRTFRITLNPVNDAPSLTLAGDQIVAEDSGLRSIDAFARPEPGGGEDERYQKFGYEVIVTKGADLFDQAPRIDGAGRLVYSTLRDRIGEAEVVVRVTDDGGTADDGRNSSLFVPFRIIVNPVNDQPMLTLKGPQAALEDSGEQIVRGFASAQAGGGPDEASQSFTYKVDSDHLELFERAPAISPAGDLTYTPKRDAVGTASVRVQTTDSGGTANGGNPVSSVQSFSITLNPVNDAPTLSVAANPVVVNEDTRSYSLPGFAHPDAGGGPDELTQRFRYAVSGNSNAALFSVQPEIDGSGRLTFSTQEDTSGEAEVALRVIDDGGTANGGKNASELVSFRVVVNPVNDAPSVSLQGDVISVEDAGLVAMEGFASADMGGGPDEAASQLVKTYNVITDKDGLFAQAPKIGSDGTLSFQPQKDATGTAVVTVTATDSGGTANGGVNQSQSKSFTITLNPQNDAPSFILKGDHSSNEDAPLQVVGSFAVGLAGGGPDEANQTFVYDVRVLNEEDRALFRTQPAISPDGTLSYAAEKDAVGAATVSVSVTDSGGTANGGVNQSAWSTFRISVNPVNDPPTLLVPGGVVTVEDGGVSGFIERKNFAQAGPGGGPDEANDPNQNSFKYAVVSSSSKLFAVEPQIDRHGTLTFTLAENANGNATVSVAVTDNGGAGATSPVRTFTIAVNPVNDAPELTLLGDQTILEDSKLQVVSGFARATPGGGPDESGQGFTYSVSPDRPEMLELFSLAPSVDRFGRLIYSPAPDAVGEALIHVMAVDDGGSADGGQPYSGVKSFFLRITGVNDAPLLSLAGDVVADEDAGRRSVLAFASASPGGGGYEEHQTFRYEVRTDRPELFAEVPSISPTGELTFTPAKDAVGIASVDVTAIDSGGVTNGGKNTSPMRTFSITLNPKNDAPQVSLLGDVTDLEDGGVRTIPRFATGDPGGGPDEDHQSVGFSVVGIDNPKLFAVEPSIDALGTLGYVLKADATGTARITVRGTDNGGTTNGGIATSAPVDFEISVSPVNDRPSLSLQGTQIVTEDAGVLTVPGFATPSPGGGPDEADQTFRYTVTTNRPSLFAAGPTISPNGTLSYQTRADANGSAEVAVTVTDSGGTSDGGIDTSLAKAFTIVVNPVNDPPAFSLQGDRSVLEDSGLQQVTGFATGNPGGAADEADQTFSYSVGVDNQHLFKVAPTISADGTLTFETRPDAVGSAKVTVTATDDGGSAGEGPATSAPQGFRITVNPVNDAPGLTLQGDLVVPEDAGPQTHELFATARPGGGGDEAAQTFTYTVRTDSPDLFADAPEIDPRGMLTYMPKPDAFGLATVSVSVADSGGTADGGQNQSVLRTFTIFVDPINDAPVNHVPSLAILTEDQRYVFASQPGGGLRVADSDAQSLSVSLSVGAGTVMVTTADGFSLSSSQLELSGPPTVLNELLRTLSYAPRPDFYGTDRLAIVTRDNGQSGRGGPLQDVDAVTLSVQPVNDAPFISVPGPQWAVGGSLVFSLGRSNQITIDDSDAGLSDLATVLSVTSGNLSIELEGFRITGDRLSFAADLAALNDALDGLVYTPHPGTTDDRLQLFVDDQGNTGRGGPLTHSAGVEIHVSGTFSASSAGVLADSDPFLDASIDAGLGLIGVQGASAAELLG
jgi:hypothetical protein